MLGRLRTSRSQRMRRHSLNSIFGLSGLDHQVQWRLSWDFDVELLSGVTLSFDGVLWVESWRLGSLTECIECATLQNARDQAALEVPSYLAWRQQYTGAKGREADIFLPLTCGEEALSGAEAVIALAHPDSSLSLTLVQRGERLFSRRVRSAADLLFWSGPVETLKVDLTAERLGTDFVPIGTVRDCGHLAMKPDALKLLPIAAAQAE